MSESNDFTGGGGIVADLEKENPVSSFVVTQENSERSSTETTSGENNIFDHLTVVSDLTPETWSRRSTSHSSSARRSQVIHDSRVLKRSLNSRPIAKLPWTKVGLVGRQNQLSKIQETFHHGVLKENGPSVITVSGPSGVGKSSLAQEALNSVLLLNNNKTSSSKASSSETSSSLEQQQQQQQAAVYSAIGKWSLTPTNEPLSILRSILSQVGDQIILNQNLELSKRILEEFEGQTDSLEWWMPALLQQGHRHHKEEATTSDADDDKSSVATLSAAQLRYVTTSILALMDRPVVIIADDVQWADEQSLNLLKCWATDPLLKRVLIMACYRSDEVVKDESHVVTETFLSQLKETTYVDVTVGPLTMDQTLELMTQLLSLDSHSSSEITSAGKFASLLYKSTGGSPFYLVSFIKSLVEDALLAYDLSAMKWTWNLEDVKEATSATDSRYYKRRCLFLPIASTTCWIVSSSRMKRSI